MVVPVPGGTHVALLDRPLSLGEYAVEGLSADGPFFRPGVFPWVEGQHVELPSGCRFLYPFPRPPHPDHSGSAWIRSVASPRLGVATGTAYGRYPGERAPVLRLFHVFSPLHRKVSPPRVPVRPGCRVRSLVLRSSRFVPRK